MIPLEIWYPRFSKRDCPVLAKKVKSNDQVYYIYFSKDPAYAGNKYIMTGKQIKEYPLEVTAQGGKSVYAIPLTELEKFKEIK
jgi:hypothetical protein